MIIQVHTSRQWPLISKTHAVLGEGEIRDLIQAHGNHLAWEQQVRRQRRLMGQIERRLRVNKKSFGWDTLRAEAATAGWGHSIRRSDPVFLGGTWVKDWNGKWRYEEPHHPGWGGVHCPQRNWRTDGY